MSEELDLSVIGEKIFSEPPKPKFSIQIQFENSNLQDIFESMLMLTTQGMKILYGDSQGRVNLSSLSDTDISKFNQYLHSFGMMIIIECEQHNYQKNYDNIRYTNLKITDQTPITAFKFPMIQQNGMVYIISFDFLRDYS